MKAFVIVTASIFGVAGAAVAADLPVRQPAPAVGTAAAPVVGKMPIGKAPIGKWPVGKAPAVVAPPPAAPPLVTRG